MWSTAKSCNVELGHSLPHSSPPLNPVALGRKLLQLPRSLSALYFLEDPLTGLMLLLLMLLQPWMALCALLASLVTAALSRQSEWDPLTRKVLLLNAALFGLFLGGVEAPATAVPAALVGGGLILGLSKILTHLLRLPALLSLPFACCSVCWGLIRPLDPGSDLLFLMEPGRNLFEGFFLSLSVLSFHSLFWAGLILFLCILRASPLLAMGALGSYLLGAGLESLLTQDLTQVPSLTAGLNYLLCGMAFWGGLQRPEWKRIPEISGGILLCVIIQQLLELSPLQPGWYWVTLPFNLSTLLMLRLSPSSVIHSSGRSPEERLLREAHLSERFPTQSIPLHCPFYGNWSVYQGVEGPWTHQGRWQHAIDFVIRDEEGRSAPHVAASTEEHYCWNALLCSPCAGIVEEAIDSLADQVMGTVNHEENWGNRILIRMENGQRVCLAHLKQHSLQVQVGERVAIGQTLARCGNSGYSPEPHLHLHVQEGRTTGEATLPFHLSNVEQQGELRLRSIPSQGQLLRGALPQPDMQAAWSYMLDQRLCFRNGEQLCRCWVSLAPDGAFQFESDQGSLRWFQQNSWLRFYALEGSDPVLNILAEALPSLPLHAEPGQSWEDLSVALPMPTFRQRLLYLNGGQPRQSTQVQYSQAGLLQSRSRCGEFRIQVSAEQGLLRLEHGNELWERIASSEVN